VWSFADCILVTLNVNDKDDDMTTMIFNSEYDWYKQRITEIARLQPIILDYSSCLQLPVDYSLIDTARSIR